MLILWSFNGTISVKRHSLWHTIDIASDTFITSRSGSTDNETVSNLWDGSWSNFPRCFRLEGPACVQAVDHSQYLRLTSQATSHQAHIWNPPFPLVGKFKCRNSLGGQNRPTIFTMLAPPRWSRNPDRAIDCGTTSTRFFVFDEKANVGPVLFGLFRTSFFWPVHRIDR